ncbi:MAG TPA: hypothetical protein VJN18_05145 [Polyangiaceae bacterium]|nr:hypothetical protein [Polyangiaceae bacterium]
MNAARHGMMVALLALAGTAGCDGLSSEAYEVTGAGSTEQARPAPEVVPSVPVEAVLEGDVSYLGLDVDPPRLTLGDQAVITQYWRLNAPLSAAERAAFGGWTTFFRAEGPYGRGAIVAQRTAPEGALSLDRWPAGTVIKEEFVVRVPENWSEPALWLFAGIGADSSDARPADSLKVMRGPDDDGWRVRALTVRVKRPWSGGVPSWVTQVDRSELSKLVE